MHPPALIDGRSDALAAWTPFGAWINRHAGQRGRCTFAARLIAAPCGDMLMLAVDMRGPGGPVATYKCNLTAIGEHRNAVLLLSPLVVIWHAEPGARDPEQGRAMIDHLVCAVRSFQRALGAGGGSVLIATGNLTEAKGGRPFFESLGWEIVAADVSGGRPGAGLARPLAVVTAQINTAVAPLRKSGAIAAEPVTVAILRVA